MWTTRHGRYRDGGTRTDGGRLRSAAHEVRGRERRGAGGRRTPGSRTPPPATAMAAATIMPRRLLRRPIPPLATTGAMPGWTVPSPEPPNRPSRRISPPASRTGERPRCRRRARHSRVPAPRTGAFRRQLTVTPRSVMRPAGPPSGGAFPFPHPSGRSLHEPDCQNAAGEDPRPHPRQRVEARHEDLRIDARRCADRDVAEFTPRRRHRGPHLRRHAYRPAWRRNALHRHHRRRRHRHRRSRRPAELRREWLVRRPRPPRGRRRVRFREPVAPRLHGRLAAAFAGRPYLARLAGRSRPGTFPGRGGGRGSRR